MLKTSLDREQNENFALKKENQAQSQEIRELKMDIIKQIRVKNSLEVENQNSKAEISQLKAEIDKIVNENNCGFLNEIIGDLKEARDERKSILAAVKSENGEIKSTNFDYRYGVQIKDENFRVLRQENSEIISMLTSASAERFEMKNEITQSCSSLALQHFYKLQELEENFKCLTGVSARRRDGRQ